MKGVLVVLVIGRIGKRIERVVGEWCGALGMLAYVGLVMRLFRYVGAVIVVEIVTVHCCGKSSFRGTPGCLICLREGRPDKLVTHRMYHTG